jgi:hypothetical protein
VKFVPQSNFPKQKLSICVRFFLFSSSFFLFSYFLLKKTEDQSRRQKEKTKYDAIFEDDTTKDQSGEETTNCNINTNPGYVLTTLTITPPTTIRPQQSDH